MSGLHQNTFGLELVWPEQSTLGRSWLFCPMGRGGKRASYCHAYKVGIFRDAAAIAFVSGKIRTRFQHEPLFRLHSFGRNSWTFFSSTLTHIRTTVGSVEAHQHVGKAENRTSGASVNGPLAVPPEPFHPTVRKVTCLKTRQRTKANFVSVFWCWAKPLIGMSACVCVCVG